VFPGLPEDLSAWDRAAAGAREEPGLGARDPSHGPIPAIPPGLSQPEQELDPPRSRIRDPRGRPAGFRLTDGHATAGGLRLDAYR